MGNPLHLIAGKKYKVIKPFTDYDQCLHAVGETWIFVETNFVPYEDGLTLHVLQSNIPQEKVYRLQWRQEEQAGIIEHFNEYVELC